MHGKIQDITPENIREKFYVCYCELSYFYYKFLSKMNVSETVFLKKKLFSEIFSRAAKNI